MKHRLKKGKSPLLSFSNCAVKSSVNVPSFEDSNPTDFSYIYETRKFISEHKICTHRVWNEKCIAWKTIPAHFEKGACYFSKDAQQSRKYCKKVRVIGIFENDQQIGNRYYWGGGLSNDKLNSYPDYSFGEE